MSAGPPVLRYAGVTDEQAGLAGAADAYLEQRADDEMAGADLGWFGIALPEALGGAGGTLADLAVVLEAAGAHVAASTVSFAAGAVGPLLARAEQPPVEALERLAAGELAVAVPTSFPAGVEISTGGTVTGSVQALGGDVLALPLVDHGRSDLALVAAGQPGVYREPLVALDPSRPLVRWTLTDVALDAIPVTRVEALADGWLAHVGLVSSLDAVGAARVALARTVDYAKTREQFGRPIGSFQAYKHRCADALVELKLGQALAFRAAQRMGDDVAGRAALAAGVTATRAAVKVCSEAVLLHGGVGYTWEAGVHRYLKRARTAQLLAETPQAMGALLATSAPAPARGTPGRGEREC